MTNVRPERRETYAPHYHRKKLVTAKKATTTGGKIKFISQFWTAAKTNFLFRAHFRHARYCSLILTDFLTGAIMESQKAAWSKATSSPPTPHSPLLFLLHERWSYMLLVRSVAGKFSCTLSGKLDKIHEHLSQLPYSVKWNSWYCPLNLSNNTSDEAFSMHSFKKAPCCLGIKVSWKEC